MQDKRLIAVIDIGSTAIRLLIGEISDSGKWRILEQAGRPVPLGQDVFMSGSVSRDSLFLSLQILNGFRELLEGWQIDNDNTYVIATSALREAKNRDTFFDRMQLKTGFSINIIEGIEENRLMYVAVQYAIQNLRKKLNKSNAIIIEVGGGSTEIMLLNEGKMVAAHSLRVGTVRIEQQIRSSIDSSNYMVRLIRQHLRISKEVIRNEMKSLERIKNFIAVGGDARIAAEQVGEYVSERYTEIKRTDFEDFIMHIKNLSLDDRVFELGITYQEAEDLVPGLLINQIILEDTDAETLIVPQVSIREGMLLSLAMGPDTEIQNEFNSQVRESAINIGKKYQFDERHSLHVTKLALELFDQLQEEHGLEKYHRLLLEIAGILHDIGTYVRASGHHKHGQYLIENSEIFGLHKDDITVIANVVRYHRKATPSMNHLNYVSLTREDRILVLKLSAMLRVADALDRGHTHIVRNLKVKKEGEQLLLFGDFLGDVSIERFGLNEKAGLFEEVFGLKPILA